MTEVVLRPIWPWPLAERIDLFGPTGDELLAEAWLDEEGGVNLRVSLGNEEETLRSPNIVLDRPTEVKLVFAWQSWGLHICSNGLELARSGVEPNMSAAILLPARRKRCIENIDALNEDALRKRTHMAILPEAGKYRRRAPPEHLSQRLREELAQLDDLLTLFAMGKRHQLAGISTRVRLLIAHARQQRPLIQAVAAQKSVALMVAAEAPPVRGFPAAQEALGFHAPPAAADAFSDDLVDLDVWLGWEGAVANGLSFTNNEVLRSFADTRGAHIDPHTHILVDILEQYPFGSSNAMETWLIQVAQMCLRLGTQLLSAPRAVASVPGNS